MDLGDLSGQKYLSFAQFITQLREGLADTMWCLEEGKCMAYALNLLQPSLSILCFRRDKAEDREWGHGEAGGRRGSQWGARTRHGVDGNALLQARVHQFYA